jgi:predicted extracellular nuclease
MKMMKHLSLFLIFFLLPLLGFSQKEKQYSVACVGFYNIENLFDTIDQPEVRDEEFTPDGPNAWTSERYNDKLTKLAYVIARIGTDISPDGMAILGLSEIENRGVIQDLIEQAELKDRGYAIVHYDSPDRRGVDVGLIYQPRYFQPVSYTHLTLPTTPYV